MNKLEKNVKSIFDTFEIQCYGNHGQISKIDLGYSSARRGEHLEFDFVAKINRIGLIIEVTAETRNQRREIRKFIDHCQEFVRAPIALSEKIRLLRGIPRRVREDFETINNWKFVYIGTSDEIIQQQLDESAFPGQPSYILNREHYEYLKFLCDRLGEFGKYEFLKRLGISPQDAGEASTEVREKAINLAGRKISRGMGIVDLYVFSIQVSNLLKISRVVRYGSLESWVPEIGTSAYQRLLNPQKLNMIRDFLKKERGKSSFPNAITVVLSPRVIPTESEEELVIPLEYGSIEVIDGQHRLFGFAKCGLSERQLEQARLIVIGLRFRNCADRIRQRWSAKAFIEINRSQTKVPTELIQLISNSVMDERTPTALAARVLVELNIRSGVLRDIFYTRPFQKANRVGGRPVRIVTVTNELSPLLDMRNAEDPSTLGIYETFSGDAWRLLERGRQNRILSESKRTLNMYFSDVANVFNADWSSKHSLIFTSKYLAAFCKLLVEFRKRRLTASQIHNSLSLTRTSIEEYLTNNGRTLGPNQEVLWSGNATDPLSPGGIPPARGSFSDIYAFFASRALE
jgi:DGQHR domain-containing protein